MKNYNTKDELSNNYQWIKNLNSLEKKNERNDNWLWYIIFIDSKKELKIIQSDKIQKEYSVNQNV